MQEQPSVTLLYIVHTQDCMMLSAVLVLWFTKNNLSGLLHASVATG